MPINNLWIVLIAFFTGLIFLSLFKRASLGRNILIQKGLPLIGGISIGLAFFLACLFGLLINRIAIENIAGIVLGSFIILFFGMIDDWRELSVRAKFLSQIIATAVLILSGVRTQIIHIGTPLNIFITAIWVIGITNAINHLDVMDGVAAAVAAIVSISFLIIAFLNNDIITAVLSLALTGALLSFLIYNLPPAKIYMGNSGSHFLGFLLAAISLVISYAPIERKTALLSPLLILGFPVFDTAFLILVRMSKKKSPFKKSNDHLALRFLAVGHSKSKALLIMLGFCLFFSLSGILLSQARIISGLAIIMIVILVSLVLTLKMWNVSIDG